MKKTKYISENFIMNGEYGILTPAYKVPVTQHSLSGCLREKHGGGVDGGRDSVSGQWLEETLVGCSGTRGITFPLVLMIALP